MCKALGLISNTAKKTERKRGEMRREGGKGSWAGTKEVFVVLVGGTGDGRQDLNHARQALYY
jgi:hypothetical protein